MLAFSIQKDYIDREATAVIFEGYGLGLDYCLSKEALSDLVPVGTVEYCLPLSTFIVDFFPECLKAHFNRSHVFSFGNSITKQDHYIKDLTGWKTSFETKLYPKGTFLPRGVYLLSKPEEFTDEWRYYVLNGDVIATGWYRGKNEDAPAPCIHFPKEYTGAADFALLDGQPELIESHAPFACGWYGDNNIDYVYWLYFAWNTQFE